MLAVDRIVAAAWLRLTCERAPHLRAEAAAQYRAATGREPEPSDFCRHTENLDRNTERGECP